MMFDKCNKITTDGLLNVFEVDSMVNKYFCQRKK